MARHAQRTEIGKWLCSKCREYLCAECVDAVRLKLNRSGPVLCSCKECHG